MKRKGKVETRKYKIKDEDEKGMKWLKNRIGLNQDEKRAPVATKRVAFHRAVRPPASGPPAVGI